MLGFFKLLKIIMLFVQPSLKEISAT